MAPFGKEKPADRPWRGLSASSEVFAGIRASGHETGCYHDFYLATSGLGPEHPVARKHQGLRA
eukprot:4969383-Lingulodinium_polyedra.AAC.1